MAKRSSKKTHKQMPEKAAPSNSKTVVGAIIAIVVLIAIILLIRSISKPAEVPTAPPAQPEAPKEGLSMEKESPGVDSACSINYAIGYPKNTVGSPCLIDGDKVTVQLVFSGKGAQLEGMYFNITTVDGQVKYFKDPAVVKQGEIRTYTVDVDKPIKTLLALPVTTKDGTSKACLNQRLLLVKDQSCVRQ